MTMEREVNGRYWQKGQYPANRADLVRVRECCGVSSLMIFERKAEKVVDGGEGRSIGSVNSHASAIGSFLEGVSDFIS